MVAAHKRDRCTVRPAPAAEPWHGDLPRRFFSVSVKVWLPRSNTRAPRLEFGRLRSYDSFHKVCAGGNRAPPLPDASPVLTCRELPHIAPGRREMKLTTQQIADFDQQGYLFFPNCFAEEEVALLRAEAENILKTERQEIWREKSGAPRTAFASHTYSEVFRLLAHHPRLVEPLQQLFGEGVYVHQFKINAKAAFEGDVWQWHQDYGTWARDDGMPQPRAMNIAVFLDEVMPINGPLMIIPKSHKYGTLAAGHDKLTTSYPRGTLDKETVTMASGLRHRGARRRHATTARPGAVILM